MFDVKHVKVIPYSIRASVMFRSWSWAGQSARRWPQP